MAQLKTMTQSRSVGASLHLNECSSEALSIATDTATDHQVVQGFQSPEEAIAIASSNTTGAKSPEASLNQAKQNATSTAQLLRRLRHRQRPSDRLRPRRVEPTRKTATRKTAKRTSSKQLSFAKRFRWSPQMRRWVRASIQLPVGMPALVSDAAVWVAVAAAVRVGLQTLIQAYPVLWFPVVVLVAGAAMLTTYQAVFNSAVGPVGGYRLLLVVIGLLLGGRL